MPRAGKFQAVVKLQGQQQHYQAEFTVMQGQGPAPLGRETSLKLNVLKFGVTSDLDINAVRCQTTVGELETRYAECFQGVGKLQNYQMKLQIDKSARRVAQPMRKLTFSVRQAVNAKITELECLDIVGPVEGPTC